MNNGYLPRVLLTVGSFVVWKILTPASEIVSPLITGPLAANQLNDSSASYVQSQVANRIFDGSGPSLIVLAVVLAAIWFKPIKNFFSQVNKE